MKKSINTWSFPSDWTLEQKLSLASEAGFLGFELDISADGPVNPDSSVSSLKSVQKLCHDTGLEISGLASGLYWEINPLSDDEDLRERAEFILRRQIESAHELGVDAILVVPGCVGADFIPDSPPVRYDIAYNRARQFIEKALPLAEQHGITIGIENVWNKFLLSPIEMMAFIDSFGSKRVASYFDVGNVMATGYPEHWIEMLAHRIVRVHVKDFRRQVGSLNGFVDLLSGDVNWPEVMAKLRQIGYDGWVAAEMIPPIPFYKYSPGTLMYNTSRAMDDIFAL